MNAVEIEEAVSLLAEQPFEAEAFPYSFLEAFGNKATTIKRLKSGTTNKSDVGGVLQRGNIHIKACAEGEVAEALKALRESPVTASQKARFTLATDGIEFQAEDLESGETVACEFADFSDHFGFFLELAGISTVRQIKENAFDIKATSRLNKLYVQLLKDNPEWGTEERRHEMNHFMARLIFCFFAEDTDIFNGNDLFTETVKQMSERDSSNTHEIISELFRAMNTKIEDRPAGNFRPWANVFPLVNGGLFTGSLEVPRFSKIARSYLLHVGDLKWTKVNPDIFGSMIQAVADDEERGALGMHYTSVPNILKVLNPLFLDDFRAKLEEAGDNSRKLLNLRNRIARVRVFDPACGSGNFLVIAYKEMRAIEAVINERRGERDRRTDIPLTNFRGIEIRDFSAEVARLALIIAEYQCDVMYRGQKEALAEFLPLEKANWITSGNALRLDWLSVCPPTGTAVKNRAEDLFETPLDQAEIEFRHESGEIYICGNPPYSGKGKKSANEIADMDFVFNESGVKHGYIDYVGAWFMKAVDYGMHTPASFAFVTTNSLNQGHQVPLIWPLLLRGGHRIHFAHTSFKWANLASHNAGVTVAIIGMKRDHRGPCVLISKTENGEVLSKEAPNINAYLVCGNDLLVEKRRSPLSGLSAMSLGNMPYDGGNLLLSKDELHDLQLCSEDRRRLVRRIYGSNEYIKGLERYALWIADDDLELASRNPKIRARIDAVNEMRSGSPDKGGRAMAARSHQLREMKAARSQSIIMPRTSSESRPFLPAGLLDNQKTISSEAFALYDAPLWELSLLCSKMHLVWIATICGQLETRYRYSNVLGWNTFPIPTLTEANKSDLTQCAEEILVSREACFPSTIAELYDPDEMPEELHKAHERNDEVLERIYIGRRFKNDTERLEKLFELYAVMVTGTQSGKK